MHCSTFSLFFLIGGAALSMGQQSYTLELEMKFFTDVTMLCDHPAVNVTRQADVRALSWIFPDGSTIQSSSHLDPRLFMFSEPNPGVIVESNRSKFTVYNLTALEIDSFVFGYYSCIVVYESPDKPLSVIRWGLNVNGADYSELMNYYKESAIIGGIAAAVFFVLVVGTCIVWHYFFEDNKGIITDEGEDEAALKEHHDAIKDNHHLNYDNSGFNGDTDRHEVDIHVERHTIYNTKM